MQYAYENNEAVAKARYAISSDLFDLSMSSSSNIERHREQCEEADYGSSMPSRPTPYMSNEDTSSNSGNGLKNLVRD